MKYSVLLNSRLTAYSMSLMPQRHSYKTGLDSRGRKLDSLLMGRKEFMFIFFPSLTMHVTVETSKDHASLLFL